MQNNRYRREIAEITAILIRHGITVENIIRLLGVTPQQFARWQNRHSDLARALQQSSTADQAESALLKRAVGFQINESTAEEIIDKKSGEILEVLKRKTITKEVPPDVRALLFYLQNRHPERWNNSEYNASALPQLPEEDQDL